jgi:hypothetical protein
MFVTQIQEYTMFILMTPTQSPVQCVPFPGGKARPGRDADHSPPSSAEVGNE